MAASRIQSLPILVENRDPTQVRKLSHRVFLEAWVYAASKFTSAALSARRRYFGVLRRSPQQIYCESSKFDLMDH